MADEQKDLRTLRGLIATVVTTGFVDDGYAACHEEMRAFNIQNGFTNVEYLRIPATLVEAGRDAACAHALKERYDWVLQIDADAAPFPANALAHLLQRAYADFPDASAFGAYCQLKSPPYLPTIDTGTGTWEPHFPGEGVLPVIRTGAHFILVKVESFRLFGPPWFRSRHAWPPLQAFSELDNFARIKRDGRNPLIEHAAWDELLTLARTQGGGPSSVGEDSGFCDALMAAGGRIYVDTDLVAGHVGKRVIQPSMLKEALDERARSVRLMCGVVA